MSSQRHRFGSFLNPHKKKSSRGFIHFLLWKFGYYNDPHPLQPIPEDFIFPNAIEPIDYHLPNATWINHSSFLIQMKGKRLLTDPIWSERCSPFSTLGPKRHHPAIPLMDHLPTIDYVIISHNHYDHLDKMSLQQLHIKHPEITWIIPLGLKKWFRKIFPSIEKEKLIELDWWESFSTQELNFHAVPAQHFSGRGLFDRNRTLWMGCIVEAKGGIHSKKFYFAGDTGYNDIDFKEIGRRFASLDLSLIPIGIYLPRGFMQPVHVNPEEAILIHKDVQSKLSIGSHWKTFRLADETLDQPPFDLYNALLRSEISLDRFRVLNPGQTINW